MHSWRQEGKLKTIQPPSQHQKIPRALGMDAHEVEELANSIMQNSPLSFPERSEVKLPEDDGSEKLPKEGGDEKLPEEAPAGKLPFSLSLVLYCIFPLDSQNPGNVVEKVEDVPQKAISVLQMTTSL
jgi:hypothetical protein